MQLCALCSGWHGFHLLSLSTVTWWSGWLSHIPQGSSHYAGIRTKVGHVGMVWDPPGLNISCYFCKTLQTPDAIWTTTVVVFAVISSWKLAVFIRSREVWKTPPSWVIHQADHLGLFIYVLLLQTDVTLLNVRSYSELGLFGGLFSERLKSWRVWHPRLRSAKKLHI